VRLRPYSTRPLVPGAPLHLDRLALVGEAAGIDATTGEGIAQAILTAAIAARHMARALRTGETSLDGYAAEVLSSRVGRHMLQSAWLARRVYGSRGRAWRPAFPAPSDFWGTIVFENPGCTSAAGMRMCVKAILRDASP